MTDLREKLTEMIAEGLLDPYGPGSDLQDVYIDGTWAEIGGGALDIHHLVSDIINFYEKEVL